MFIIIIIKMPFNYFINYFAVMVLSSIVIVITIVSIHFNYESYYFDLIVDQVKRLKLHIFDYHYLKRIDSVIATKFNYYFVIIAFNYFVKNSQVKLIFSIIIRNWFITIKFRLFIVVVNISDVIGLGLVVISEPVVTWLVIH